MITQERVKELFNYNENTGDLTWKVSLSHRVRVGSLGGYLNSRGYRVVRVEHKNYAYHRFIWLWWHGYMPENLIDHRDKDRSNNKIDNLREVSNSCNLQNTGNPITNTSGVKGVCWVSERSKWFVALQYQGRAIRGGYFKDFKEAVSMRLAIEQCVNWSNCDSSSPAYRFIYGK